MPRQRSLGAAVFFFASCGLTIAAIGVSIAAMYVPISQTFLAGALGAMAFLQLSLLIRDWLRPTIPSEARIDSPLATAAAAKRRIVEARAAVREAPDLANSGSFEFEDVSLVSSDPGGEAAGTAGKGMSLLDKGKLDLLLEPVVELDGTSTVYYRASVSLNREDGSRVGPYLLALSAERGGFMPVLDLALFRQVCPVLRHLKARNRRAGVFCPLSAHSFADRNILDELIRFLRANQDAAGGMVIEVSQASLAALSPSGMEGLAYLAELGATLSLSDARVEGPDPATLALLGFRFLDLDIAALASTHGWDGFDEGGEVSRLAGRAEQAGLTVIAANIASAPELERVRMFARLARGSLFSPPRIVRRDIADRTDQAAAA